ncbi:pentatricopeptide repeat-containing protein At5g46100-like [Durio zibethinus]|uniref:Pentatricopeptide repeat-containing protein At5g46100-like n=1 Tax=Durio zibethinus TaxID=66656 RepID=A0A6P5WK51_DURZI|nr:pentatricopeptide repeat-containing protein At5g46100-like [Durio zibethinus]XP_022715828.1 pentatricopeptide repeat-containing protein At5g46100-like [Durio zibethinus]
MGTKVVFKWSKKITTSQVVHLIKAERNIDKALAIFDSATAEYANGFRHDHSTFGIMISKLVSANKFRPAEDLLDRMKVEKCDLREDIFLSICRGYGRVHRPFDAIRVFDKMREFKCEPSKKSYITVFDILVEENQLKIALRFYRHMKEVGVPTSVASLNILIKALCKNGGTMDSALHIFHEMPNRGCPPDSYTYGTLINGFCRFGKITEAKELFEEMKMRDGSPSVVTYSSLIHGLCQSKNLNEAIGLLEEMKCNGIEPNVFTYSSLMDGLCKDGRSSEAMELLETMVSKSCKPNTITYSILIHGLCKEGKLQEAVDILDRMKLQGLQPDAGLYGKIISGFCNINKFQEAANFLDEMILGRTSVNRLTWSLHVRIYNMVVQGLCTKCDLSRAFQLYLSMRTRGISVETGTFETLMKSFCKKGDLHKAVHVVDEMVIDGCIPEEGAWSTLLGAFWDERMVQESIELFQVELISEFAEPDIEIQDEAF